LVDADALVDIGGLVPAGIDGGRIGAGTTLAALEADSQIPAALREACRLAASPQLRNMGTVGGNLLQATRCWYWRLHYPCRLHGGDRCHARDGQHREHAIFANDFCASAHPSDVAAALLALGATLHTSRRELPVGELYRVPTEDDRRTTTLEPGEVILELDVPSADASVYLKAMDRKRWAFPLVGVAAARLGETTRVALAGVAPVPWLLTGSLDDATPLPGTAYKLEIARALHSRALAAIGR
jgi:xanthine dehydrogenase YagS FAD-binding subunit